MASNTKSNSNNHVQNDSKPELKNKNSNINHYNRSKDQAKDQPQNKPLTPASSLPSKPSFTKKTSGWAAIAASKSQETSTTTKASINPSISNPSISNPGASTPGTSTTTLKKSKQNTNTQVDNEGTVHNNVNQRTNKKTSSSTSTSAFPSPAQSNTLTDSSSPSSQKIKPNHTPINNFNTSEIFQYLTNRTSDLHTAYPIETYKNTGSEWSKLSSKFGRKNEKDVVVDELSRYLSKSLKN